MERLWTQQLFDSTKGNVLPVFRLCHHSLHKNVKFDSPCLLYFLPPIISLSLTAVITCLTFFNFILKVTGHSCTPQHPTTHTPFTSFLLILIINAAASPIFITVCCDAGLQSAPPVLYPLCGCAQLLRNGSGLKWVLYVVNIGTQRIRLYPVLYNVIFQ